MGKYLEKTHKISKGNKVMLRLVKTIYCSRNVIFNVGKEEAGPGNAVAWCVTRGI